MTKTEKNADIFDAVIAGGGLVGLSLALALESGGLKVAVIDTLAPTNMLEKAYDGRSSAIAFAAMRMLEVLGVKENIQEIATIDEIMVVDGRIGDGAKKGGTLGLSLHLGATEAKLEDEPLGYMVENRFMRLALDKTANTKPYIVRITPDSVIGFEDLGSRVSVQLKSGKKLDAKLLIGCDGRGSMVRNAAKIKTNRFDYSQTGIVTTVKLEKPHNNIAYEYFLPSGPFAILPLTGNRASIVWSEPPQKALAMAALEKADIEYELQRRFAGILGKIEVCAPIFTYPLKMELAAEWYKDRVVLAGDAAHGIHPVAGQGFNLGLKDVAALAQILVDSKNLGLDIGDKIVLERYAAWRRTDTMMVALACDGFVRLFSNDIAPLRLIRNIGMGIADKLSPIRNFLIKNAGGAMGDLPLLLRGEPLP